MSRAKAALLYGLALAMAVFHLYAGYRDARLFVVGDGSSQIQRNLIARQMGL